MSDQEINGSTADCTAVAARPDNHGEENRYQFQRNHPPVEFLPTEAVILKVMPHTWDYLILTASNDRQAAGYESQLAVRRRAGLLPEVGTALVVADPLGKRVGSGGSTLYCLMRVLEAEIQRTGRRGHGLSRRWNASFAACGS